MLYKMTSLFVFFSAAVRKTMTGRNLGREGFVCLTGHSESHREAKRETQCRSLKQEPRVLAFSRLYAIAQDHLPRDGPSSSWLALPMSVIRVCLSRAVINDLWEKD